MLPGWYHLSDKLSALLEY